MLRGARLVTAIETEEGRRWAESRIKSLTGGDRVAARFMRQDFFEFTPQFKLVHCRQPQANPAHGRRGDPASVQPDPLRGHDPGRGARPELTERLRAEWPRHPRWMIEGCLEWQRQGLRPPKAVTEATADYLAAEDAIAAWLEECCEVNPNVWDTPGRIYASWKAYAERTGEIVGPLKSFGPKLEARGFAPRNAAMESAPI